MSQFVLELCRQEPETFEYLETIVKGSMRPSHPTELAVSIEVETEVKAGRVEIERRKTERGEVLVLVYLDECSCVLMQKVPSEAVRATLAQRNKIPSSASQISHRSRATSETAFVSASSACSAIRTSPKRPCSHSQEKDCFPRRIPSSLAAAAKAF